MLENRQKQSASNTISADVVEYRQKTTTKIIYCYKKTDWIFENREKIKLDMIKIMAKYVFLCRFQKKMRQYR
jgi:hypothetical protein